MVAKARLRRMLGRVRKRRYADNHALHAHENEVVLRDLRELGGTGSAVELALKFRGRYDRQFLPKVLKRMYKSGLLERGRRGGFTRSTIYSIRDEQEGRAA